ncbi:MAG: hypothetical protein ACTSQA_09095 [Candidatus Heimdallarchaeaceae archaeon]
MKLYIDIKKMTFEDNIEHQILNGVSDKEFLGYDEIIELPDDDKFIKDTLQIKYKKDTDGNETDEIELKMFVIKEQKTWWNFPLYELKNGKIKDFDYTKYQYFADTDRRNILSGKIKNVYNPSSEAKILRKTLRYIMDTLKIEYPDFFRKYNNKVEDIINRNPKGGK